MVTFSTDIVTAAHSGSGVRYYFDPVSDRLRGFIWHWVNIILM